MFNLTLHTLNLVSGKEEPGLPGLLAVASPRRSTRTRTGDLLIALLQLESQIEPPVEEYQDLLKKLSTSFFSASGSVTSALRQAASQVNDLLLARNSRASKGAGPVSALLNLVAVHNGIAYFAHSGPVSSFYLGKSQVQVYRDAQNGRGLGLSRTLPIRFYQALIEPGDLILLSHRPPSSWTADAFTGSPQLSMDHMRRRLLNQSGSDIQAVLISLQTGKGDVSISSLLNGSLPVKEPQAEPVSLPETEPAAEEELPPVLLSQTSDEVDTPPGKQPLRPRPLSRRREQRESPEGKAQSSQSNPLLERLSFFQRTRRKSPPQIPDSQPDQEVVPQPDAVFLTGEHLSTRIGLPPRQPQPKPALAQVSTSAALPEDFPAATPEWEEQAPVSSPPPIRRPQFPPIGRRLRKSIARAWLASSAFNNRMAAAGETALKRVTPSDPASTRSGHNMSFGALLFVAVAVPLMIAALAATVYIRNGYGQQHQIYLAEAQEFVAQADAQSDPILKRQNWVQALQWLNKADEYGKSDGSIALRQQVQLSLDEMDGIQRIELLPAVPTQFDPQIQVGAMVMSADEDIYVLDRSQGRILRLVFNRPDYEIDPAFICGPGQTGAEQLIVGPLVDLAAVRPNNAHGATVMGIDQMGNILFCGPHSSPEAITLIPPDSGWMGLTDIVIDGNTLFVFDSKVPGVWRYTGDGVDFFDPPRLFFDNEVPPLADVINIAVYQDDLFLLHQDGHMTKCTYSEFDFAPTRCTEPMPYHLPNEAPGSPPVLSLAQPLAQMQATDSPAYSLFLFSGDSPAIYYFSLALNLQTQLRPSLDGKYPLPQRPATAFLITPTRRVVVAYGNEIFYGFLP